MRVAGSRAACALAIVALVSASSGSAEAQAQPGKPVAPTQDKAPQDKAGGQPQDKSPPPPQDKAAPPQDKPTPAPPPAADTRREPSAGDLATARAALREGLTLREKGELQGALGRLSSAYDLVPTPVTGFELGKTQMMAGNVLQAHELFKKVERMPLSMEESVRSSTAREEAARLAREVEPRIPSLRIRLKLPPGASAVVRIDDDVIPITGTEALRAVDPGSHEVAAKAGEGPEQKIRVSIAESEVKDIDLAPQWIAPKVPDVGPDGKRTLYVKQTNPLVFVGFGVAGASLIFTSIAGVTAVNRADQVKDKCGREFCSREVLQRDGGITAAWLLATIIGGGATLSFLVMGIVSVKHPVKEKVVGTGVRPFVGLGGAGLEGSF